MNIDLSQHFTSLVKNQYLCFHLHYLTYFFSLQNIKQVFYVGCRVLFKCLGLSSIIFPSTLNQMRRLLEQLFQDKKQKATWKLQIYYQLHLQLMAFCSIHFLSFIIYFKINYQYFCFAIQRYYQLQLKAVKMMIAQESCPKCEQRYTRENPPKNLINCEHVICYSCLNNQILCPVDRKRIQRRKYTIEAFITNEDILQKINKGKQDGVGEGKQALGMIQIKTLGQQILQKVEQINTAPPQCTAQQKKEEEIQIKQQNQSQTVQVPSEQTHELRYQDIKFQTCLLHSRCADLICMQDKCLICTNCGLFGEHKHHNLMPYDNFIVSYTSILEQTFTNYEKMKKCEEKISQENYMEELSCQIKLKRDIQIKNLRKSVAALIQGIKKTEKKIISELDKKLNEKQQKLMKQYNTKGLKEKLKDYYEGIQEITRGSSQIFRLENVSKYVQYVDQNNQKSYVIKQGEYLIAQVESQHKKATTKMIEELNEFQFKFNGGVQELLSKAFTICKRTTKESIKSDSQTKQESLKEKTVIKVSSPKQVRKSNEQDLLINSKSNEEKKKIATRQMSPIQPIPKFQQTFDQTFKNNYKENIINERTQENFLNIKVSNSGTPLYIPLKRPLGPTIKQLNVMSISKQKQNQKQGDHISHFHLHPKIVSTNSSHVVERQILNVLNEKGENKRRRKLDLPQKYMKIYDQLCKDRLDILDLGGAGLGDQTVLSISELFESRNKLKTVKLMNNKLTDDAFPEILVRCRNTFSLNLSYNNLTEKCLDWLEKEAVNLGNLTNITVSNNKIVLRNVKDRIQNLRKKGLKISL